MTNKKIRRREAKAEQQPVKTTARKTTTKKSTGTKTTSTRTAATGADDG